MLSYNLLIFVIFVGGALVSGLPNMLNTPEHACVRCLCHAVSGCYQLRNCARYSVSFEYWSAAGAPVVDLDDSLDMQGYTKCINNNNCIVHTIHTYTAREGQMDCNCDGGFTCEDRVAIHYGMCENPSGIPEWNTRRTRYRSCSGVSMQTPTGSCTPQAV